MINGILVEVCCGSVDDCIIAEKCGADRIELNHALEMGGMTPSCATLRRVKELMDIKVCCMVRPRGFGFNYSDEYYRVMLEEAKDLLANGADGIVFGFLNADSSIDIQRTKEMVNIIKPKEAVFHKAFDSAKDMEESIQILIKCGIDRVLTSGQGKYPDMDLSALQMLNEKYGDRIQILPGGGVREHNVQNILKTTGIKQIHMTSKHLVLDPSTMDDPKDAADNSYIATDEKQLKAILEKIREIEW